MPGEHHTLGLQCSVLKLPAQQSQCREAVSQGLLQVSAELGGVCDLDELDI